MSRTSVLAVLLLLSAAVAHAAKLDLETIDADRDGTLSLSEVQAAAAKKYNSLDANMNATIDGKEAAKPSAGAAVAEVGAGKKETTDKAEYIPTVEKSFKAADSNNDGKLDAVELSTPAGHELLSMIQSSGSTSGVGSDTGPSMVH